MIFILSIIVNINESQYLARAMNGDRAYDTGNQSFHHQIKTKQLK